MPFRVKLLRRAETNVDAIVAWLVKRSPLGAVRWLVALENAKSKLADDPLSFALAPESDLVDAEIRQIIFKTKHGRRYRAVFTVVEEEVRVVHVRGPGQAPLKASDLATD